MLWKTALRNGLAFGLPVAAAVGLLAYAVSNKSPPQQEPPAERVQAVRTLLVTPTTFIPKVIGYGAAEPARVWDAVAQVAGRVEFVHPNLRSGALFRGGIEIIRIAKDDYQIAVSQAEANLDSSKAKLVELQVRAENAQSSLAIETRSLEIYQLDFDRKRKLVARKVISQSILEEAQRTLLVQQAKVQDTQNTIRLSPSQIEAQKRQIEVNESQVKAAKLNLARTSIRLPFDARIASESIEPTQFVSVGTKLATADDIGVAEINAQVPQSQFSTFARLSLPKGLAVSLTGSESTQAIIAKFGWEAKVRMRFDDGNVSWPARVIRTSDTIDPKTRTIGAIVAVDKPYGLVEPGKRPPLVKGMFVQVEISGKPIEDQIVIPRSAIRQGRVYISDTENRLRIRPVEVLAEQGADAVISSGLSAGETLVVSDLAPALEGMLLDPRPFNPSPLRPDEANAQSSTGVKRLSTGNGQ